QQHALLCLRSGDRKGYQDACAGLAARRRDTWTGQAVNFVAEQCVLGPDALPDAWHAVYLTELAAGNQFARGQAAATRGPALYRAGRLPEAVAALDERLREYDRLARPQGPNAAPVFRREWVYLAMAHQRLGNAEEAARWLERAEDAFERPAPAGTSWA